MNKYKFINIMFFSLILMPVSTVNAQEACTIIVNTNNSQLVYSSGEHCGTRYSPASTFKLAIAAMGFDANLLNSPNLPKEEFQTGYLASFKSWRRAHTPETWLKHSVIWYSQLLTQRLGINKFQNYVDNFHYGNLDLSGDLGKNNGLTRAWLSSSLKISPQEQIKFLKNLVTKQLPMCLSAHDNLLQTVERFKLPSGWALYGKTGNVWQLNPNGMRTENQQGWFVG